MTRTTEATHASRSYRQYCAVARGLDLIGERWTLLIVRDLLTGPKRYSDLLAGLPGIGTNLLAARLRELSREEIIVRRVLPPPAASTVYELTDVGQELEPVLMALGRWGRRFLGSWTEGEYLSANAYLVALRAAFHPDAAAGMTETFELRVGEQVFEVRIADGACTTRETQPANADVVLTLDVATLGSLLHGRLQPEEARASGLVNVSGDSNGLQRFVELFAHFPREGKRASSPSGIGATDAKAQERSVRPRQRSRTR
jgi:DNA-binding HxlR family transcriptional regulator/putative sterol carrier protein